MAVGITVNLKLVDSGEFSITFHLAPAQLQQEKPKSSAEGVSLEVYEGDRILPIGSSTIVPGFALPLAS